jgi:hypothetical protein
VPSERRVTSRISSSVTGAVSGTWWRRSQAKMRCQPSPTGATKANASPTALTASAFGGGWASRTSASMIEVSTDFPGNGRPSAPRTALRTPSAPTA